MLKNFRNWKRFAANVARYLILIVDLHQYFRWFSHKAVRTNRTLIIISLAAKLAKKLIALIVGALHRNITNFMTNSAQKVLIHSI
jgi:hypothetical protein